MKEGIEAERASPFRRWPNELLSSQPAGWCTTLFCVAVAGLSGALVSVSMAPTGDEFHTLAYMREPSLGQVWRAYQDVGDTLPLPWYWLSWFGSQTIGHGLAAPRLVAVASWALAAGVLARLVSRWGRTATVAGALLPTASALVFVGSGARPYGSAFLAVCVAVWAWVRSVRDGHRYAVPVLALACFVAVSLHFVALAAVLALVVAEVLTHRPDPGRRVAALMAFSAGLLPILIALPLLADMTADHSRIPSAAGPLQVVAFYWSASRPMLGPLLLLALIVAGAVVARRGGYTIGGRLQPEELSGICLLVLVPAGAVTGMALTSGVYLHRYSLPALAGAGLVVGSLTTRLATVDRRLGILICSATLLGVVTAPFVVAGDHVKRTDIEQLPVRLALSRSGSPTVIADPYTFELLTEAHPQLELRLAFPSPYAGRDRRVTPDVVVTSGTIVAGRDTAVREALALAGGRCDRILGQADVSVSGERRTLIACTAAL